ncbi:MAG: phytanoyl-CoA dioxygenase family protein [Actinobacteria bacterium]|nr:phytanoyl-CoA dioxygenase family protein [Actinomycetota bacterium]
MSRPTDIASAEQLASEGNVAEAIARLSAINRTQRDPAIETRLVALRRDAPKPAPNPPRRWPPRARKRFRVGDGPPEVRGAQLYLRDVQSGILRHGSLLVRGLLSPARVTQLVEHIDRAFDGYDAFARGTPASETAPSFVPYEAPTIDETQRTWIRNGGGVLAVESPSALFDVIEAFDDSGISAIAREYLGEPPMILASKWTLRRIRPSEHTFDPDAGLDFHQDGSFMGTDIRTLNVWVALSHCGLDAPGLDIVPRRLEHVVRTGSDGAGMDWTVGPSLARQVGPIATPIFAPGDALLFDHLMLHRTGLRPQMTADRYAIEAWFAAPSTYADAQLAITY